MSLGPAEINQELSLGFRKYQATMTAIHSTTIITIPPIIKTLA